MKYNFKTLDDVEFEEFARDILSTHLNIDFRTYNKGRDLGIDLSCNDREIIVQVKHYANSTFSNLKTTMKEDYIKIERIEPKIKKYILFTSLGLSVGNFEELKSLSNGLIQSNDDIYDLNKINDILLEKGKEWIEKKYYKLWITSTNVMDRVFNKGLYSNIDSYSIDIKDKVHRFVITKYFYDAIEKLKNKRLLLIHGNPGVGKTTLAELIIFNFIEKGYTLKYVSGNNISELEKILSLDENEKEIILLDDFLGSNILELLSGNTENQLHRFLLNHKNKRNRYILLTTRTTIMIKAFENLEKIKNLEIKIKESFLEISDYKENERAKILYSHFYWSNLEKEKINQIKENKNYRKIINHPNYNPRIIEFFTDKDRLENIQKNYMEYIEESLNNPSEIWKYEFEKLTYSEQILLITMVSFNSGVSEEVLEKAYNERFKYEIIENNVESKNSDFKKSIINLSKSFIKIIIHNNLKRTYQFMNPSIRDFLLEYIKYSKKEVYSILKTIRYINQLEIFDIKPNILREKAIQINDEEYQIIENRIISRYKELRYMHRPEAYLLLNYIRKTFMESKKMQEVEYNLINEIYEKLCVKRDYDIIDIGEIRSLIHTLSLDENRSSYVYLNKVNFYLNESFLSKLRHDYSCTIIFLKYLQRKLNKQEIIEYKKVMYQILLEIIEWNIEDELTSFTNEKYKEEIDINDFIEYKYDEYDTTVSIESQKLYNWFFDKLENIGYEMQEFLSEILYLDKDEEKIYEELIEKSIEKTYRDHIYSIEQYLLENAEANDDYTDYKDDFQVDEYDIDSMFEKL